MDWFHRNSLTLALLVLFALPAIATPDLHDASAIYQAYITQQRDSYDKTNAEFHAALAAAPDDVMLAVAHCKFIGNFTYAEDIMWTETADTDFDACEAALLQRWPNSAEVQVHQLEAGYGDNGVDTVEAIWRTSRNWPRSLRGRMAAELSETYQRAKREDDAGQFAVIATELGQMSLLPEAISYLATTGKTAHAIELTNSIPPAPETWEAVRRIRALRELPDKTVARRELERTLAIGVEIPATTRLRVYLDADELTIANRISKELGTNRDQVETRACLFDLALANHQPTLAIQYLSLSNDAFDVTMQRYATVLSIAPRQALSWTLLPITFVLLLAFTALVLAPGVLLIPVHYRGLMRRTQARQPPPLFERVGLRHAWIGGAIALLVPTLAMCAMRPDLIGSIFPESGIQAIYSEFGAVAIGTLAGLAFLLPWLPRFGIAHLFGEREHVLRTLGLIVLCWLVVFTVSWLGMQLHHLMGSGDTSTLQTKTITALVRNSKAHYGLLPTLILMAGAIPIFEELVFRGLLLGGLSRHISFGWSNTLQSLLFAVVHDDPPRFFFYWVMGLLAGWLVRRHRTLWPAIALHGLNNAVAMLLLTS